MTKNLMNAAAFVALAVVGTANARAAILETAAGATINPDPSPTTVVDTSTDAADWIDSYGPATASGTLYYGFDFTVNDNNGETGSGGYWTALQLFNGGSERLGIGNNWNSLNLSTFAHNGDQDLDGPTPYVVGATYRLVAQIDFVNGGDDLAKVWINPTSIASPSKDLGAADASFDSVLLRGGDNTASTTYANIIFATTFNEAAGVVPEPASVALIILGGLLGFAKRRRP